MINTVLHLKSKNTCTPQGYLKKTLYQTNKPKKSYFNYLCIMYVSMLGLCRRHVVTGSTEPNGGASSLAAVVTGGCEPSRGCWVRTWVFS